MSSRKTGKLKQRAGQLQSREAINQHISKALGNSLREQIMWILGERTASPSEIAKELGESLNRVSHHMKVLREAECITLVEERIVGGAVQHFYRATARVFLDDVEWPDVPERVRHGMRATLLQAVMGDAIEALAAGLYDSCESSHMSWTPMIVDEQGREELTQILERSLHEVLAVQKGANERLRSADVAGTSYSVSLLGYPSIGGETKVGPPSDVKQPVTSAKPSSKKAKKVKGAAKGRTGEAASR